MFCYGSGYASAFFSIRVTTNDVEISKLSQVLDNVSNMKSKLEARTCVEPAEFVKELEMREKTHHLSNHTPLGSVEDLFPGTYFLLHVDDKFRRTYARKTKEGIVDIHDRKLDSITNGDSQMDLK